MGLIKADTGTDLVSGLIQNVAIDYHGLARLASVIFGANGEVVSSNLNPDPGFKDFKEDTGKHRYFDLGEPERPTHWAPFIRDNNNVKQFSRQVTNPIPLKISYYDQIDELVFGTSPLEADRTEDIAPPIRPRAKAINVGPIGFPEGFYTIAFAWILGADWEHTSYMTAPGPRLPGINDAPLYIPQGGGILVTPPSGEIPPTATGIAIYLSEPRMNADPGLAHMAALAAPLYRIARIRVQGMEQYVRLTGGFKWNAKSDGKNNTFIGDTMSGLKVWKGENHFAKHKGIRVRLGYSLVTQNGTSMSHREYNWQTVTSPAQAIKFIPKSFPPTAIGWQPEIQFDSSGNDDAAVDGESTWYALTRDGKNAYLQKNEVAGVWTGNPENWPDQAASVLTSGVEQPETDGTGVANPSETLEMPTVIDLRNSGLTMGPHLIKTALYAGEGQEGRISPETRVNLPDPADVTRRAIRIFRPLWHNKMDNENLVDRDVKNIDLPRGWIIPGRPFANPNNLTVHPPREGVLRYLDNTNATTNFVAFKTPFATLEPDTDKFLIRFKQKISNHVGGKVKLYLEEYANGADEDELPSASTLIGSYGGNGEVTRLVRLSRQNTDPTRPDVLRLATSSRAIRLRAEGDGNARTGGRNFDVEFSLWGAWEGWGEPRKQTGLEQQRSLHAPEPEPEVYPHGGYCVIRENPTDGPVFHDYTVVSRQGWEDGLDAWTTFATPGLSAARNQNAAITNDYGLRINKGIVTATDNTDQTYAELTFADKSKIALATDVYLKQYSNHTVELFDIRSGNNVLALLRVTANGLLQVITIDSGGVSQVTQVASQIDDEEHLSVEFEVDGMGTANGTLKVYLGRNRGDRSIANATIPVNWTGRQANAVTLGQRRLNLSRDAIYTVFYDNTLVSIEGSTKTRPQGGNYVEYYGPYRTPKNEHYGPYGMRIPVKPNTNYAFGVNVWYDDLAENSDVFRMRAMDADHNEITVLGTLVKNVGGDSRGWERYTLEGTSVVRTPEGTAYVEFFANNLGGGTLKVHGLQIEEGTVARPFSMTRARAGNMSVFFTTTPKGMFANDKLIRLSEVKDIRRFTTFATDNANTSYGITYRSGLTLDALLSSTYKNTWEELPTDHKYFEARISLVSTADEETPEVRGVKIDVVRPDAILCSADGTEYKGGVLVNNVGGVHAPPREDNVEMASGAMANNPWGRKRVERISFNVYAFRRSTMERIVRNKKHVLELPDRKYTIYFEEAPNFTGRPETRIYYGDNAEFFQVYAAEGVTGWIESEVER